MKKDDDGKIVRCRLVARDFKPRHEGPRDDLLAAMPPLEATKERCDKGQDDVKVKFVDVTKTRLNAKCEEEELADDQMNLRTFGKYAKLKELVVRDESSVRIGGRLCKEMSE